MTEKQDTCNTCKTCENCGHEEYSHEAVYISNDNKKCSIYDCTCKKFKAKKSLDKKSKGCEKEYIGECGFTHGCGQECIPCFKGINLCPECKAKNHSSQVSPVVTRNNIPVSGSEDTPSDVHVKTSDTRPLDKEGTFNLSEEREQIPEIAHTFSTLRYKIDDWTLGVVLGIIEKQDKEAIRKLKEEMCRCGTMTYKRKCYLCRNLDKIFGSLSK